MRLKPKSAFLGGSSFAQKPDSSPWAKGALYAPTVDGENDKRLDMLLGCNEKLAYNDQRG
jgi:hypothetical protein